jgi:hypothetical protein
MKGEELARFALESNRACGCCAVFKGRREVRPRGFRGSGLSKLNSMLGLELRDVRHHAKAWWVTSFEDTGWPGQVRSTY